MKPGAIVFNLPNATISIRSNGQVIHRHWDRLAEDWHERDITKTTLGSLLQDHFNKEGRQ
jgi:hypothetical protein